jgi:hypothetical protein
MNPSSGSTRITSGQKRKAEIDTRLHGRLLVLARFVWIVVVGLSLAISLVDISLQFARLHIVCVGSDCGQQLTVSIVQDLHKLNLSVDFFAASIIILEFGFYIVWVVVAFVIFWRKSNDWMALLVALFLILFPASQSLESPGTVGAAFPHLHVLTSILDALGWLMLLLFFFLFPDGRFVPRWTAWVALCYVLVNTIGDLFPNVPSGGGISFILGLPLIALVVGIGLFSQVYRYIRVSSPIERQQTKWVLFGVLAAVALFIVLAFPLLPIPKEVRGTVFGVLIDNTLFYCATALIPLSIGFSILRYRLYDIDFLINRTLVYGTLTVLLALIYFGCVFVLQNLVRGFTGQVGQSQLIIVGSTLVIAAIFHPLRRRIQQVIDRRFYRRKYNAAKTVEEFSATLRNELDLSQLREHLITVVQETMQPAHVSLWLRQSEHDKKRRPASDH